MAKSAAAALHTEPKEPNFLQKFGHDFVHGDIFTKLSFFVWGLGYIGHGQLMKALLVTFVQGFALYFLAFFGVPNLAKFDPADEHDLLYRDRGTDRGGHDGGIFQLSAAEDP